MICLCLTTDTTATDLAADIISRLRDLGYSNALLQENYAFRDWFTPTNVERRASAVAFGQTPVSYDSALIAVAIGNGLTGRQLVNSFRSLGAPFLLELNGSQIREWAVSRTEREHFLIGTHQAAEVQQLFVDRAQDWRPDNFLRAKNIRKFSWLHQPGLFDGLLPELESQIQAKLGPLLQEALRATQDAYKETAGRDPSPETLFKLVFWLLTAKVFSDRHVPGFINLGPDPDAPINAVASYYREPTPRLLNNHSRAVAAKIIWTNLDFRNLSVDVLSELWLKFLVNKNTRKQLGIHLTPRSVVRYIVEKIPFSISGDESMIVFEPCCGSAGFLIGSMGRLRQQLFGMTPKERHSYFVKHLAGTEQESFGVEVSKLVLTLADFPQRGNGWDIQPGDVFLDGTMAAHLQRSGVVLCNPPWEEFTEDQRKRYKLSYVLKPAELIARILNDLHQNGVLGIVLPRLFVDGQVYGPIREALSKRFARLELTILPDRAFEADAEPVLLIASEPIPHNATHVVVRKVNDDAESWKNFDQRHDVNSESCATLTPLQARATLLVPELQSVWQALEGQKKLDHFIDNISRGIRWKKPMVEDGQETGTRKDYEQDSPGSGLIPGVASRTKFSVFEVPSVKFLSIRPEDRATNAWSLPWQRSKVIFGKSARSRGHWKLAAFPDREGLTCFQTYTAVWPKEGGPYDEVVLSAILNSPLANAFVATREGKTDITIETIRDIPMPVLNDAQRIRLRELVTRYQVSIRGLFDDSAEHDGPERLLKEIDAVVLDGYRLPPRVERELLEFFRGHKRRTRHHFGEYIPKDCDFAFSLSRFLAPNYGGITANELLSRMG